MMTIAFAASMMVISVGSILGNYQELILALKGAPAFLASALDHRSVYRIWMWCGDRGRHWSHLGPRGPYVSPGHRHPGRIPPYHLVCDDAHHRRYL
jgi:hypothetical protein